MLPEEGAEPQIVVVPNDSFGSKAHGVSSRSPAMADFTILATGERKTFRETTDLSEETARHREVVAGDELPSGPVGPIIGVQDLQEALASLRVEVLGQGIVDGVSEKGRRAILVCGPKSRQPVWIGPTVIVGEHQELPRRCQSSGISRDGTPLVGLLQKPHVEFAPRHQRSQGHVASIVHDDDLEAVRWEVLAGEGL